LIQLFLDVIENPLFTLRQRHYVQIIETLRRVLASGRCGSGRIEERGKVEGMFPEAASD
jgi:hypothetical protein